MTIRYLLDDSCIVTIMSMPCLNMSLFQYIIVTPRSFGLENGIYII